MNARARKRLGTNLRAAREDRSPTALAKAIGDSRQSIWKWESGTHAPPLGKLVLYCRELGITVEKALDGVYKLS